MFSTDNKNSEMGQDRTSGPTGKVKRHRLGDYIICQPRSQALILTPCPDDVDFMGQDSFLWELLCLLYTLSQSRIPRKVDEQLILLLRAPVESPGWARPECWP